MHQLRSLFLLLAALLTLAACVPERVVWSPDGTRAAVLADDGLRLADLNGALGPVIAETGNTSDASAIAWLPDGKSLILMRNEDLTTWQQIAAAFPEKAKAIVADAGLLQRTRESLVPIQITDTDSSVKFKQTLPEVEDDALWAAIYLRDNDAAALRAKVGDGWNALAALKLPEETAQVYMLASGGAAAGAVLWRGLSNAIYTLRVSPTGAAVVITSSEGDHGRKSVASVVSLRDPACCVLGESALYSDWSPDGRWLYYIKPLAPAQEDHDKDKLRLGMLVRQRLFDDADRALFGTSAPLPQEESLVGLFFNGLCRVRAAKDGRVFFVAGEINLPTTPGDFDPQPTLFSIEPGKQATISRVIPRSSEHDLGDAAAFFELSPDAAHISAPFQDGRVSVVTLATGDIQIVQPFAVGNGQSDRLTAIPTWRPSANGGELTFVAPTNGNGPATTVIRYALPDGKRTVFSESWPDAARGNWLAHPAPTTAP